MVGPREEKKRAMFEPEKKRKKVMFEPEKKKKKIMFETERKKRKKSNVGDREAPTVPPPLGTRLIAKH